MVQKWSYGRKMVLKQSRNGRKTVQKWSGNGLEMV